MFCFLLENIPLRKGTKTLSDGHAVRARRVPQLVGNGSRSSVFDVDIDDAEHDVEHGIVHGIGHVEVFKDLRLSLGWCGILDDIVSVYRNSLFIYIYIY